MSASAQRCFEGKLLGERTWVCKTIKRIPRASLAASWQQYPIKSRLLGWFLFWICSELRLLLASSCSLLTSRTGNKSQKCSGFSQISLLQWKAVRKIVIRAVRKTNNHNLGKKKMILVQMVANSQSILYLFEEALQYFREKSANSDDISRWQIRMPFNLKRPILIIQNC